MIAILMMSYGSFRGIRGAGPAIAPRPACSGPVGFTIVAGLIRAATTGPPWRGEPGPVPVRPGKGEHTIPP
jgi:hypothetical protein